MKRGVIAKKQKQNLPVTCSKQTDLSTQTANVSQSTQECKDHKISSNEETDHSHDPLEQALSFLRKIKDRTSRKNEVLQKHLLSVERIAQERGLTPEEIDALLNIALSGKFAEVINTRVLKNLIPISAIKEDSIVSAVSWLCVGKCSRNTQVLFLKWLIAMYDFIDHKEKVNALYGFFFNFLQDEKLCPFVCHVLYVLTRRENVKPFRVRRLLDLRAKMGSEAPLQALILMYKSFVPTMVPADVSQSTKTREEEWAKFETEDEDSSCTVHAEIILCPNTEEIISRLNTKELVRFKNSENLWKTAISNIKQRIYGISPVPQPILTGSVHCQPPKKKWNSKLTMPTCNTNSSCSAEGPEATCADFLSHPKFFPVQHLQTFPQLLENIHCLELPTQIGSVLGNRLLLHYINCVRDDVVYQRMYFWLGQTFREECPWIKIENQQYELDFKDFLGKVLEAECFLQEGFSSCEEFLYRSLPFWDGCCCRSQVLQMISWIPLSTFSEMKPYLCKPLTQLFFTSSLYFKCSVLESLRELLLNWLNWHLLQAGTTTELNADVLDTTLSGLVSSVAELIRFVGWLSTIALHLENNSALLMYFILDFYEIVLFIFLEQCFSSFRKIASKVCDMYQKYNFPLVVMPPAGVFYPALLSMDSVTVDHLCCIMVRYRTNLIAAKQNQQAKKTLLQFKFSNQTCQEYNQYITSMVGCLWTSNVFQKDFHPQGIYMEPEVLEKTTVQEYRKALNIVYHPALTGYAILFVQQAQSEDKIPDIKLIQGRRWDWYLEYLYSQELQGLKLFIESSITRVSRPSQTKPDN